ncbi:glycoside hydrolase family 9 protein [Mariniphaga sp.]|uniref:glycoside hydrolase family 9 protein n=1 Tax=Mariniphaga sp. TaxID=1954475 RepID=UPI0035652590
MNNLKCFRQFYLLILFFFFAIIIAKASDVVEVFALNSKIVVIQFKDGYVEYHKRNEPRQKDRVVHQPLVISEAVKTENYFIKSTEGYYSEVKNPLKVERKSKGTEFTWLCQGWSQTTGCINSAPDHSKEHWLYLHLPEPLEMGKTYNISTGDVAGNGSDWELNFNLEKNRTEAIHVNLVGYDPRAPEKFGYVYHWAGTGGGVDFSAYAGNAFYLIDLYSHEKVFSGTMKFRKSKNNVETMQPNDTPDQNFLGADVYECDFSAFNTPGEYYLAVEGIGRSFSFKIERDIYRHPFYISVRGLYHNRSGIILEEPFTEFARPTPHNPLETPGFAGKLFYSSSRFIDWNDLNHSASDLPAIEAGIKGPIKTWGWYQDAGDWDGYFTHLKIPVMLMLTWEIAPEKFSDGELNLPEGTNQIPDILDEARWLIRFFHRTRHEIIDKGYGTGGVGSRVAPDWYGHAPEGTTSFEDTGKWVISGEDPFTTYFYAGLAAQYALVLNKLGVSDPEEINWQTEAEEAFNWAQNNTLPNDDNPDERHNYDLSDFKFYAAAALYRLTGESIYLNIVEQKLNSLSSNSVLNEDSKWGAYSMVTGNEQNWTNTNLKNKLNGIILATADQKFTSIEQRACRYGGNIWLPMVIGQGTTPRVFEMMMGHYVSKEAAPSKTEDYLAGIFTTADYFLGCNPMNMTWITHVGVRFPERVMHLDSWYSDTGEIIPGITPYGPWRDQPGGSAIGPWDLRWSYKTLYPEGIQNWPGHERWYNNYTTPVNAEFTVHQNTVLSAVVYGYLCDVPDGSYQPNKKPSVLITSPENESENQGALSISVEVDDPNGPEDIAWVEFYSDWHKIGQTNEPPYSFTWKKPADGAVKLSAKVVDKSGFSAKSETITVLTSPPTGYHSLQHEKGNLTVFPNPVSDFLEIESSEKIVTIEIFGFTGSKINHSSGRIFSGKILNFTEYPEGLYILKLIFSDGTSQLEKIIKKSAY